MKNIVIVNKELQPNEIPPTIQGYKVRKNKTIFKDSSRDLLEYIKLTFHPDQYKWYIEEWEFASSIGFQIVVDPRGMKMRPVHIVSSTNPPHGFKALFQVESLITFAYQDGAFILKRAKIDPITGWRQVQVVAKGDGVVIEDICNKLPEQIKDIIKEAWQAWQNILEKRSYENPLFAKTADRQVLAVSPV